jgi:hypothetical protein
MLPAAGLSVSLVTGAAVAQAVEPELYSPEELLGLRAAPGLGAAGPSEDRAEEGQPGYWLGSWFGRGAEDVRPAVTAEPASESPLRQPPSVRRPPARRSGSGSRRPTLGAWLLWGFRDSYALRTASRSNDLLCLTSCLCIVEFKARRWSTGRRLNTYVIGVCLRWPARCCRSPGLHRSRRRCRWR